MPSSPARQPSRTPGLVALGVFLARRGLTAALGLALTVACVAGFGAVAFVVARRGRLASLPGVPLVASSALAFGVGVLVAFAVSTRAFRRDEDDGVRALLQARGVSATGYLAARVAGLTVALAALVGGGSLAVGLLSLLAARGRVSALHSVQASLAALAFALAFAATFAPVAMATLGSRSRGGGYGALLLVLVGPELARPYLARALAGPWLDVASIPGALLTLRASLAPPGVDPAALGRSLFALVVVAAGALLVVRAELAREHGSGRGPTGGRAAS